ncbi:MULTISPECIES: hypothetical protein [environmental samples]|uniref:hypothetical protein n=1 Tax=environmental samples TaxID=876090 RepID=UPI000A6243BC|nr:MULTISPECIES: hypothetical protein [environmental samples]
MTKQSASSFFIDTKQNFSGDGRKSILAIECLFLYNKSKWQEGGFGMRRWKGFFDAVAMGPFFHFFRIPV